MRPLVALAIAFAAGIAAAHGIRPHPALPAVLAGLALVGAVLCARRECRTSAFMLLLVATIGLGALRYAQVRTEAPGPWDPWYGRPVLLVATVREVHPGNRYWTAVLATASPQGIADAVPVPAGQGLLVTGTGAVPPVGYCVRVSGTLDELAGPSGPNAANSRERWARRGVFAQMQARPGSWQVLSPDPRAFVPRLAHQARGRMEAVYRRGLDAANAALLAGLVLGEQGGLPDDWVTSFRLTGTIHILAASGANVALVTFPIFWLLGRLGFSRRRAALVALPAAWLYCFMAGADPPVMRATLMATLVLVGQALDRPTHVFTTMAAAAVAMLAMAPGLLFDLGFQLSFAATAGIVLMASPIGAWLGRWFMPRVALGLGVTLAAQLATEPLLLVTFGLLSPVAPLANLVAELFVAVLVWLGLVAGLIGQVWAAPAHLLLAGAGWLLKGLTWSVGALSALPGAAVQLRPLPAGWAVAAYILLGLVLGGRPLLIWLREFLGKLARWRRQGPDTPGGAGSSLSPWAEAWRLAHWRRRRRRMGATAAAVILLILAAVPVLRWRLGEGSQSPGAELAASQAVRVHFLPVGQGEAVVVQVPGGAFLIDAGPADSPGSRRQPAVDAGRTLVAPYLRQLGIRELNAVILLSSLRHHVGGVTAVLDQVPVRSIWLAAPPDGAAREVVREAQGQDIPVHWLRATGTEPRVAGSLEQTWPGPGWQIRLRAPGLLHIRHGTSSALVLGHLTTQQEAAAVADGGDWQADVLALPRHGQPGTVTAALLAAVQPRYAVHSPGPGALRRFAPDVRDRLEAHGVTTFRTDRHGVVTFALTGSEVRMTIERVSGVGTGRWLQTW